jgi:hypothetical protein
MPKIKVWATVTAIATGVVAISAAAATMGYEFDRPAWHSEVERVAERVDVDRLRRARVELHQAIRERKRYEQQRQDPPPFLLERIDMLKDKIRRTQSRRAKRRS